MNAVAGVHIAAHISAREHECVQARHVRKQALAKLRESGMIALWTCSTNVSCAHKGQWSERGRTHVQAPLGHRDEQETLDCGIA